MFSTDAVFGLNEPNETVLGSVGFDDLVIARYNSDGTLAWARAIRSTGRELPNDVITFPDGSPLLTGAFGGFGGTLTFGTTVLTAPASSFGEGFHARLDANGDS